MLVHWIWFAHRPGLSDRAKAQLMQHFSDPEDIFYADSDAFSRFDFLTEEGREALKDKDLSSAGQILETCDREKIHILTYRDAAYPVRLKILRTRL